MTVESASGWRYDHVARMLVRDDLVLDATNDHHMEDVAERLTQADRDHELAALAEEANNYCEYARPFGNEDSDFWDGFQDRYHALTATDSKEEES